jgi:hypothetical protein
MVILRISCFEIAFKRLEGILAQDSHPVNRLEKSVRHFFVTKIMPIQLDVLYVAIKGVRPAKAGADS